MGDGIRRPEGFKFLEASNETECVPFTSLQGFEHMIPLSSWKLLLSLIDDAGENPSMDTKGYMQQQFFLTDEQVW